MFDRRIVKLGIGFRENEEIYYSGTRVENEIQ